MKIVYNKKEIEVIEAKTIKDILNYLNLTPTTVISLKNGKIVEINEKVHPLDKIEIIKVISGG